MLNLIIMNLKELIVFIKMKSLKNMVGWETDEKFVVERRKILICQKYPNKFLF